MVDNDQLHRSLFRLQRQAELLLNGPEDIGEIIPFGQARRSRSGRWLPKALGAQREPSCPGPVGVPIGAFIPSGEKVSVKSYFAVRPVASPTGRLNRPVSRLARSNIVCCWPTKRARPGIIIRNKPARPAADGGSAGNPSGPILGAAKGAGAAGLAVVLAGEAGLDAFIFGPFFATTSEYIGSCFVSLWIVNLNRSASRF